MLGLLVVKYIDNEFYLPDKTQLEDMFPNLLEQRDIYITENVF